MCVPRQPLRPCHLLMYHPARLCQPLGAGRGWAWSLAWSWGWGWLWRRVYALCCDVSVPMVGAVSLRWGGRAPGSDPLSQAEHLGPGYSLYSLQRDKEQIPEASVLGAPSPTCFPNGRCVCPPHPASFRRKPLEVPWRDWTGVPKAFVPSRTRLAPGQPRRGRHCVPRLSRQTPGNLHSFWGPHPLLYAGL